MTNRLDSELDRFAALEKEVRDAQTEARRAKRELETLQDKQSVLSKELNRYCLRIFVLNFDLILKLQDHVRGSFQGAAQGILQKPPARTANSSPRVSNLNCRS